MKKLIPLLMALTLLLLSCEPAAPSAGKETAIGSPEITAPATPTEKTDPTEAPKPQQPTPTEEQTTAKQEDTAVKLRLATYNIHNGADVAYDFSILAADITRYEIDIVALQEVDQNTSRNGNQDTVALLKQHTGYEYGAFAAGLKNYKGGQYGVAVVSKYPILSVYSAELPEAQSGTERREYLEVTVQVGNAILTCYSVHCNQVSIDLCLQAVAERAKGREPYAVMGDFNWNRLANFSSAFPNCSFANHAPNSYATTANGHAFDNMILSPTVRKDRVMVLDTKHSDHFIMLCDVTLPTA